MLGTLFPTATQLCTCTSSIDPFGPICIRRHDALTSILFYSMQLGNPGVLHEQRISGDNQSQSGDLYHPDFCQSCPVFFDVSVQNTLFPSIISQASVSAGAAAAGEAFKDKHHENNVITAGIL